MQFRKLFTDPFQILLMIYCKMKYLLVDRIVRHSVIANIDWVIYVSNKIPTRETKKKQ